MIKQHKVIPAFSPIMPVRPSRIGNPGLAQTIGRKGVEMAVDAVADRIQRAGNDTSKKVATSTKRRRKVTRRRGGEPSYDQPEVMSTGGDTFGSAFAVIEPGPMTSLWDEKDPSYYTNPSDATKVDIEEQFENTNTARVQTKTINVSVDSILSFKDTLQVDNSIVESTWTRIFSEYKYQVNKATSGGNVQTRNYITATEITNYFKYLIWAHHLLSELNNRQCWDPIDSEINPVIRLMASSMKTDTELFSARDRLQDVVANLALPTKLMSYLCRMWYPYKISSIDGGVMTFLTSKHLNDDLHRLSNDEESTHFYNTKEAFKECTTHFSIVDNVTKYSAISALLMEKTPFDFTLMRYIHKPISSPVFDAEWNCWLSNSPISIESNVSAVNHVFACTKLTRVEDLKFGCPLDDHQIPKVVSAHLLMSWGDLDTNNQTAGFPFWNVTCNKENDDSYIEWFTDFIWFNKDASTVDDRGYQSVPTVDTAWFDKVNHCFELSNINRRVWNPRGHNVREYSPSFKSCSQACSDWMKHLFI